MSNFVKFVAGSAMTGVICFGTWSFADILIGSPVNLWKNLIAAVVLGPLLNWIFPAPLGK